MSALSDVVAAFRVTVEQLTARIRVLESNDRAEIAGAVPKVLTADLPAPGQPGRLRWVTDGTPGLYADDGVAWVLVGP